MKYKKEILGTLPFFYIPDKTRYLHYDNLGSIDTITDGQGNIVGYPSIAFASFTKGGVCHALNDVALSIGDGVY
jgi:hypothetical protein